MSRQHLCSGYVATLSCIICISITTYKVYRDRGLLPLSLTSCCNLVLMSRHDSSMFNLIVLSRPSFHVTTELLCIVLKSFSLHRKVCRNLVSLYAAYLCVTTLKSVSRHRFISSALKVCCNVGFFCYDQASSTNKHHLSRHNFIIMTELLLSVPSYVSTSSSILQE